MTWRFEHYETLASTSDLCRERAEAGEKDRLAIMAERQSAARGSRGRGWDSGEGNLAFSFLFHFSDNQPSKQSVQAVLPYLLALALYDGLLAAIGPSAEAREALVLKWPNDLLLSGRKMAGILIETGSLAIAGNAVDTAAGESGRAGHIPPVSCPAMPGPDGQQEKGHPATCWAVIGMGVNLRHVPVIPGRSLAALSDLLPPPEARSCAEAILSAFDHWMARWQEEGPAVIWDGWMEHAHPLGTRLTLVRHGRESAGRFAGLDMQGHLLLARDDGAVTTVVTGDILCE